jgi:hypothetical protein
LSAKPRRIRKAEEPVQVTAVPESPLTTESIPTQIMIGGPIAESEAKPSDAITVKVVIGSLMWTDSKGDSVHYEKGETFICTRKDLAKFDPRDIEVIA